MERSEVERTERKKSAWTALLSILFSPGFLAVWVIFGTRPLTTNVVAYVFLRSWLASPSGIWVWSGMTLGGIGFLAGTYWLFRGMIRVRRHQGDRKMLRNATWGAAIFIGSIHMLFIPEAFALMFRQELPEPLDVRMRNGRVVHVGPEKYLRHFVDYAEKRGIFFWLEHY